MKSNDIKKLSTIYENNLLGGIMCDKPFSEEEVPHPSPADGLRAQNPRDWPPQGGPHQDEPAGDSEGPVSHPEPEFSYEEAKARILGWLEQMKQRDPDNARARDAGGDGRIQMWWNQDIIGELERAARGEGEEYVLEQYPGWASHDFAVLLLMLGYDQSAEEAPMP
mgnify:CR=1 FL=1